MNQRIWLNTNDAAAYAGNHPVTLRKAFESGELHGSQRTKNGRWRVHVDCLDAWCAGVKCEHQKAEGAA